MKKDITIQPGATIREAMEALDKTAEKVLLVIDNDRKLIGTVTDGDIRRYILKEQKLNGTIEKAYYRDPIFIRKEDFNREEIKRLLTKKKIELIPVIDRNHRIVDFVTWEKIFGNGIKENASTLEVPVVIMAGGRGTRLEPFTKVLPKPLVPVGEKPVIDHIIDRFRAHGVSRFYITIQHMSRILRAYFEEKAPDFLVEFAEEESPGGTAGSLRLLVDKLDMPFFVSNCDVIIEADYGDLYRFHIKKGYDITLVASAKQFNIPYGICELNDGGNLKKILEKPNYNFLVNTGLYVLNPEVIDLIPDHKMFHITHLMEKVKENKGKIGVYPVSEKAWIDVGQWAEYREALKAIEKI